MRRARSHRRSGFTLTETAVSFALLASVMLVVGLALDSAVSSYRMASAESELDARVHRAVNAIVEDLSDAGADSVGAASGVMGDDSLAFSRPLGWDSDAGAITWSAQTSIAFQLEAGELDDDKDNDGDGLIDEGEILWTYDVGGPSERSIVRLKGVAEYLEGESGNLLDDNGNGIIDESGLDFEWDGNTLTVRLTLEAMGPRGVILRRTAETTTRLRN